MKFALLAILLLVTGCECIVSLTDPVQYFFGGTEGLAFNGTTIENRGEWTATGIRFDNHSIGALRGVTHERYSQFMNVTRGNRVEQCTVFNLTTVRGESLDADGHVLEYAYATEATAILCVPNMTEMCTTKLFVSSAPVQITGFRQDEDSTDFSFNIVNAGKGIARDVHAEIDVLPLAVECSKLDFKELSNEKVFCKASHAETNLSYIKIMKINLTYDYSERFD